MGVRRAVEMALDAPGGHEEPIYTYGSLIHNPQVTNLLKEKGISPIDHIPEKGPGTVLIRAHGVPSKIKTELQDVGFTVIDATCPRVIKVQTIIRKHVGKGCVAIIVGNKEHPEVVGLLGYAGDNGVAVNSLEELDALPDFEKAIIVAQTTQNTRFYEEMKEWVERHHPHYRVFDTICDSTGRRQAEVKRLAENVDTIIVVGGKESGNTKRLFEIGKQTGKPTFHVESESELDIEALSSYDRIGITAGASTPNWILKRVYRKLETLSYGKAQSWFKAIFAAQRALLLTNIYVSFGAGCLCYSSTKLLGLTGNIPNILIAILYIQSMHILNNITGRKEDRYNDPDRAVFYDRNKILLSALAFIAGGVGLLTAYTMGIVPFLILFVMSLLGLSYNLRLFPGRLAGRNYYRIRDIPGSKTILIAVAWGAVTSLLPPLSKLSLSGTGAASMILVFVIATLLVFARTAFFDILDMQGDRIVGKGTIPILIGEKRAMRMLKMVLLSVLFLLLFSSAIGLVSSLGYFLLICPVFLLILFSTHQRGYMQPGIRLEFLVESHFFLAGILTFLWVFM